MDDNTIDRRSGWARAGAMAALAIAALVAACGGGGGGDGTSAQAAAFTTGPVTGFGSIIVNGVRFDDSSAEVEDEDGGAGRKGHIKLGTMVEVESQEVDDATGRAKALRIRYGSEIVGPVASVDAATSTLVVLGQTVDLLPSTVLDDSLPTDLNALVDSVVEVHALFDAATGRYVATRVEPEADADFFKLRGRVAQLDPTTRTFRIGDAVISYASIADADLPAAFADGAIVRVRLAKAQVAGPWVAVTIRSGLRKVGDHAEARLRGTVSDFTSTTVFSVNGLPVDASGAEFERGTTGLELGARVEVLGRVVDGTLVASRVKVLRGDDDEVRGVELHGTVGSLDREAGTFVLRDLKVHYGEGVIFKDGDLAKLVDGAQVEVKGVLSADRTTLVAVVIEFES